MSDPLSVQAAIAAIIRDMPAIGKDDKAPGNMGGFSYRGIEAMTRSIQPLLGQHGVVIIPQAGGLDVVPAPGQKEAWQDVRIRYDWLIVGPDGSSLTAATYGIGRDHTDKGANKAQTQAFKYLLMALFCVSDPKDDADGHDYTPAVAEPHPNEERVAVVLHELKGLTDTGKEAIRGWADGRKLSGHALIENPDWLELVEAWIDEHAETAVES